MRQPHLTEDVGRHGAVRSLPSAQVHPSLDRWGGENTALNRPSPFTSIIIIITDMPHQTHHYAVANPSPYLSEEQVQDAFHSYLKSSLTQAKVEGLLPPNVLSSAEGDLMVTGE